MNELVVVGGGGHAKVVISVLKKLKRYEIIGYTDILNKGKIFDVSYLGDDDILGDVKKKYHCCSAVLGIGIMNMSDMAKRCILKKKLVRLGYQIPAILSPDGIVNQDVSIGEGTVILDGVQINCGSVIGDGSIINSASVIEHDCLVGDNVHVCPGAILCGGVIVGDNAIIGPGACITQGKKVERHCRIGAGAVVVNDCKISGDYVGSPARRLQ